MQDKPTRTNHPARIVAIIAGLVFALVVGTPWLLHDAPPSPEAVIAAKLSTAGHAQAASRSATTPVSTR